MWQETAEGLKFIEDFSKQIVGDVAPEELEFFDELAKDTGKPPSASGDAELGFGLTEALEFVTPATISVVTAIFTFLGSEILKSTGKEAATAIVGSFKSLFSKPSTQFNAEQIAKVKEIAQKSAKKSGVDEKTTKKLIASLVAALMKSG
jgi:hypothetical protein